MGRSARCSPGSRSGHRAAALRARSDRAPCCGMPRAAGRAAPRSSPAAARALSTPQSRCRPGRPDRPPPTRSEPCRQCRPVPGADRRPQSAPLRTGGQGRRERPGRARSSRRIRRAPAQTACRLLHRWCRRWRRPGGKRRGSREPQRPRRCSGAGPRSSDRARDPARSRARRRSGARPGGPRRLLQAMPWRSRALGAVYYRNPPGSTRGHRSEPAQEAP